MAKFIGDQRYDEDEYPISPMGVRTGPRRIPYPTATPPEKEGGQPLVPPTTPPPPTPTTPPPGSTGVPQFGAPDVAVSSGQGGGAGYQELSSPSALNPNLGQRIYPGALRALAQMAGRNY